MPNLRHGRKGLRTAPPRTREFSQWTIGDSMASLGHLPPQREGGGYLPRLPLRCQEPRCWQDMRSLRRGGGADAAVVADTSASATAAGLDAVSSACPSSNSGHFVNPKRAPTHLTGKISARPASLSQTSRRFRCNRMQDQSPSTAVLCHHALVVSIWPSMRAHSVKSARQ